MNDFSMHLIIIFLLFIQTIVATIDSNFTGKVVLVTGSNSGIGEAIVKLFAQLGAQVVITGRNVSRIDRVAQEVQQLSPKGLKPLKVTADLTKTDELNKLLAKTIETYGQLDILVNNAAIDKPSPIIDPNFMHIFDEILNIDLRAVAQLIHLSVPYLKITNGTIINISAIAGILPDLNYMALSVAKASVIMMSKVLSIELSPQIRVNTISPGYVLTPEVTNLLSKSELEQIPDKIPLKRMGKPSDIAKAVMFLASNDCQFINGANLVIDGGEINIFP